MPTRRCFRFAYLTSSHKDRERHVFQLRDGEAALWIMQALAERGYRFGGPIVNYPSPKDKPDFCDGSFLSGDDIIFLTTRPPMHDADIPDRKGIPRSYTLLEKALFDGPLSRRFVRCARSEVLLTDETAAISPEIAERQSMIFRQNGGAMYQSYGSPTGEWQRFKQPPPLTAAFLVYTEHAWPGGPALRAAFGMGGTETLVWCYQLATRFQDLLFTTPFAMVELKSPPAGERPTTIAFADAWEVTILGVAQPGSTRGPIAA